MKILLKSGLYHGIATHDEKIIHAAIDFARKEQVSAELLNSRCSIVCGEIYRRSW